MVRSVKGMKVCDNCGCLYLNFCLNCERMAQPERVHELLTRYKLDETNLIKKLHEMVEEGSFPALNLAVTLRDMKPAQKNEVNVEVGKTANEARDRLSDLFSKLSARRREKGDPE